MYKITYTGDGVTTDFLFSFPFFNLCDIKIALDDNLLDGSLYSVTPNHDFTGGTVTFVNAPDVGIRIDVFRQVSPTSRIIDYQPTDKIDPEHLNSDFNFLVASVYDIQDINIDLMQWKNIHDNVVNFLNYTHAVIEDKLGGGAVLGLYNNLLSVLHSALPLIINDYGSVTEPSSGECDDDYGVL